MLLRWQRNIIFGIFCVAVITFLGIEAYLLYSVIANGFSPSNIAVGLFSTAVLAGLGLHFRQMVEANFLKGDLLPPHRLHRFYSDRNRILEQARRAGTPEVETKRNLLTNTLKFAEETFHQWIPGNHFELCVFVDADYPVLFSYFDTNGDETPRSMAKRLQSASYYADKGYEIVPVIRSRSSQAISIQKTADTGYKFASDEQKRQIRSTVLLSLDADQGTGLVVSSNAESAFPDTDQRIMDFIRLVGELVKFDLFDEGFITRFRTAAPEYFSMLPAPSASAE